MIMELERGTCFLCRNAKVIKPSQSQKACKIITIILNENLNFAEFDKLQKNLKFCPICYHKLVILKRINKNLGTNVSCGTSGGNCLLCKNGKNLVQINNWLSFKEISEELDIPSKTNCVACSECLFYLETKRQTRIKLFSKYPQLKNEPVNSSVKRRKWKLKFSPNVKLQSTPLSQKRRKEERRSTRKRKYEEVITISDDELPTETNISFKSLKGLKPLKDNKLYQKHRLVITDSKFLNQVPYVLINMSTLSNISRISFDEYSNNFEKSEEISKQNDNSGEIENEESTNLNNNGIQKHLVINVWRIDIDKYITKYEPDPDIQNLIHKFNDLSQSEEDECSNANDTTAEIRESSAMETEARTESKNKRKSVSFAEDKNIEIEYFENRKVRTCSSSDEDSNEAVGKRYNKGILKRDENTRQNTHTSGKQNTEMSEESIDSTENQLFSESALDEEPENKNETEIVNCDSSEEETESKPENDIGLNKIETNDTDLNNMQKTNAHDIENETEENSSEEIQKSISLSSNHLDNDKQNAIESKTAENRQNKKSKKSKPKPLSKKKKSELNQKNIVNDIDTESNSRDNIIPDSTHKNNDSDDELDTNSKSDDMTAKENINEENQCEAVNDTNEISSEEEMNSSNLQREDNKSITTRNNEQIQKNLHSSDLSDNDKQNAIESKNTEKALNQKTKKYKPKPLSKKKKSELNNQKNITNNSEPDSTRDDGNDITPKNNEVNDDELDPDSKNNDEAAKENINIEENISESVTDTNENPPDNDAQSAVESKNTENAQNKKIKKNKPKPLSKKKKWELNAQNNIANSTESKSSGKDEENDPDVTPKNNEVNDDEPETDYKNNDANDDDLDTDSKNNEEAAKESINIEEKLCESITDASEKSSEEEMNSSNLNLENDKSITTRNDEEELNEEVLTETGIDSKQNEMNKSSSATNINKSESESDVTQLIDKYLSQDDDVSSIMKTPEKDETLKGQINIEEEDDVEDSDKNDCTTTDSFNKLEKNDDLGISEVDNENINSLLSHIFPPVLPDDDKMLFETKSDSSNETDSTSDKNCGIKRKHEEDDDTDGSKDKKKKKVTFCDDVT